MEKNLKELGSSIFGSIVIQDEDGSEMWSSRELAEVLGYTWEGFAKVVARTKVSIAQTGLPVDKHIRHVSIMLPVGQGAERPAEDFLLTRHACYVVAQNGDPLKKPAIAAAQAYFAIQTRKQEISEQNESDMQRLIARQKFTESDKHISTAVMEKGIRPRALGAIKSSGDSAMFGGKTTKEMKVVYGISKAKTPLANRMPNVVLAAKSLANEITAQNLEDYPIEAYDDVKKENDDNNQEVRRTLIERGIVPEALSPAEDTSEILSRLQAEEKKEING